MTKIITAISALLLLVSCGSTYDIQGSSNVPVLDGRMLFLKVYSDEGMKNIDSCDIVHGQFHFLGSLDTVKIATLFMDDESIMPVVLERGDISLKIDNAQNRMGGTPLNDKLYKFLEKYNQLMSELNDLGHQQSQAIMDGKELHEVNAVLEQKAEQIAVREEELVTKCIEENFDNILGPGVFFMMTASHPYPELSPWIEALMSKATDNFRNDPYVRDYYRKAQQNEAIMNGTATPGDAVTDMVPQANDVPTPNQLAQPAEGTNNK